MRKTKIFGGRKISWKNVQIWKRWIKKIFFRNNFSNKPLGNCKEVVNWGLSSAIMTWGQFWGIIIKLIFSIEVLVSTSGSLKIASKVGLSFSTPVRGRVPIHDYRPWGPESEAKDKPITSICGAERADLATKLLDNEQVLSKGKCRYYTWTVCQVIKKYFFYICTKLTSLFNF